jgi:hypothetical protein
MPNRHRDALLWWSGCVVLSWHDPGPRDLPTRVPPPKQIQITAARVIRVIVHRHSPIFRNSSRFHACCFCCIYGLGSARIAIPTGELTCTFVVWMVKHVRPSLTSASVEAAAARHARGTRSGSYLSVPDTDARPQGVTQLIFSTSAAKGKHLYTLPRPTGSQASPAADANND